MYLVISNTGHILYRCSSLRDALYHCPKNYRYSVAYSEN